MQSYTNLFFISNEVDINKYNKFTNERNVKILIWLNRQAVLTKCNNFVIENAFAS